MKRIAILTLLLFSGILTGFGVAQTNTPTAVVTVTAAKVAAVATVTPTTISIVQGATATLQFSVTGAKGVPTGTVQLLGEIPGQTSYTLIQTFTLANGSAACTYALPVTAPAGVYNVEAAYSGDNTYLASSAFKPAQ